MTARSPEPERVAERAYSIWEEEGRPSGRDHAHWHRAERELAPPPGTARGGEAAAPAEPPAKKPGRVRKAAEVPSAASVAKSARARKAVAAPATEGDAVPAAPKRARAKVPAAS